jgi:AmmeMemoRadiSam system protein B
MRREQDEEEHSLEMHLPYIHKMLSEAFEGGEKDFPKLVPILVGNAKPRTEIKFGELLAPYLEDPGNFFIISSDFCHWGSRFRYTYYVPETGKPHHLKSTDKATSPAIHESIAQVDKESWEACETGKHSAFVDQLERTGNTVCGRHPIGVMMAAIEKWRTNGTGEEAETRKEKGNFRFVRYERSSLVQKPSDSSVSYCSAYAVF